jgi:hypothetical protein
VEYCRAEVVYIVYARRTLKPAAKKRKLKDIILYSSGPKVFNRHVFTIPGQQNIEPMETIHFLPLSEKNTIEYFPFSPQSFCRMVSCFLYFNRLRTAQATAKFSAKYRKV